MKKTLCLLIMLTSLAQAKPYTNKNNAFSAEFTGPVSYGETKNDKAGKVRFFQDGQPRRGNVVLVLVKPMKPSAMIGWMLGEEKFQESERKQTTHQGFPALRWSGLDRDGVPYGALAVQTKSHSYMALASGYDMAAQQRFLDSLRILVVPKKD